MCTGSITAIEGMMLQAGTYQCENTPAFWAQPSDEHGPIRISVRLESLPEKEGGCHPIRGPCVSIRFGLA